MQTQMQTKCNPYDGYINDSDLIGTHSRMQLAYTLSEMMAGEWADVTNPGLDLDDFIGKSFTTGPDGKLSQLSDISCPTSSLRTFTGSARTGSTARI